MTFARIFYALLGAALLAGAILLAFEDTESDPDQIFGTFLLGLPILLVLAGFSFHATARAIRNRLLNRRTAALFYAGLLVAVIAAYRITFSCLVPASIRFEFSYPGNTGTYQMVQFYFKHDGQWLKGPSVEGWPLTVRFPDLNGDGYPDIRVTKSHEPGSVEFVYLPTNDGHIYWRAIKNDTGLSAAYAPANYFSNCP